MQVINGMSARDHKQLWHSLLSDRFDQFWAVNGRLMEPNGDEPFHALPIRIYKVIISHHATSQERLPIACE